jgi:hypothetical protein
MLVFEFRVPSAPDRFTVSLTSLCILLTMNGPFRAVTPKAADGTTAARLTGEA